MFCPFCGTPLRSFSSGSYAPAASAPSSGYGASGPARREGPAHPVPARPAPHVQAPAPRVPDAEFHAVPPSQLKAGMRVEHNRFGFGDILEISGSPADPKARIRFDDYGEKTLLLKYARLRPA